MYLADKLENITFHKPSILMITEDQNLSDDFLRKYRMIFDIIICHRADLYFERKIEKSPDAIILSVMPSDNINGLTLLNSFISNTTFNSIPVISIIEDETEDYIQIVLEKGATDYVTKAKFFNLIRHKINAFIRIKKNIMNCLEKEADKLKNDLNTDDRYKEILSKFISEVDNIIENDKNILINEIAKKLHVTLSFLEKIVKLNFDKGPRRYILDKRLEKADFLLKSKKTSIKNIAFEIGFNSTAYFTKCYRLKYGKTPKSSKIFMD